MLVPGFDYMTHMRFGACLAEPWPGRCQAYFPIHEASGIEKIKEFQAGDDPRILARALAQWILCCILLGC